MRQIKHPSIDQIQLTDVMYALSDPARLEIVKCLASADSLTCSQLDLNRPKSSMSHHFKVLREAGLVHTRVEGKEHFNCLRRKDLEERFPGLLNSLLQSISQE